MNRCFACHFSRKKAEDRPLSIEMISSVGGADPAEWDRVVFGRNTFLSRAFLSALEASDVPVCHAIFRQGNQTVGTASFQIAVFKGSLLSAYLNPKCPILALVARPMKFINEPFLSTMVVCGTPLASGEHGYAFLDCVSEKARGTALCEAAKSAKAILDEEMSVRSAGILFKEFCPDAHSLVQVLGRNRFAEFQTDPSMVLPVDSAWTEFADYLASLSSKYRVKANREFAKSKELVERDLNADRLQMLKARVAELYSAVADRADFKLGSLEIGMLIEMRRRMGEDFLLKGYFLDNRLVGFLMGFVNGDTLETGMVGFDYSLNRAYAIYPRMLYDYLRTAIDRKLSRVNYGRTASEIKSTLGAVPVQMSCALTLEKKTLNRILPLFSGTVRPQPFSLRKPFKQSWYEMNEVRVPEHMSKVTGDLLEHALL